MHMLNSIIILRTWFRWDDAFELLFITVEVDPHNITPAEIAINLHLAQYQLLKALNSDAPKEYFQMIRRNCIVPKFRLEYFELVGNTVVDPPIDLQSELLKAH